MLVKSEAGCLSIDVMKDEKKNVHQVQKKQGSDDSSDSEMDVDEGEDIGGASYVYAGYADGSIKKWELKSGNCTLHIEKQ